jgi:long-chain acyl-CoA synthetase
MMVEVSSTPLIVTTARTTGDGPSRGTYGRVTAWLAKRVEFALAQVDLTLPQYRVLGILVEGSAAASGLAGRLAVRPSSVTAIIDGLVARGLVDRTHQEDDRRRIALRLTEEGERVLAEADLTVDAYMVSIAGHLPDADEVMVLRSLELWGQALATFHQARAESR